MTIWNYIMSIDPEVQIIFALIILYGSYRGIVKIPFITWPGKRSKKGKVDHSKCKNYSDFVSMLDKAQEAGRLPYVIVRDQMTVTEEFQDEIRDLFFRHFLKLLKKHRGGSTSGLMKDPDTEAYELVLDYSLLRVKQKVRFFFQENHLAELSEAEFILKSNDRIEQIFSRFTTAMNDFWLPTLSISREDTYDWNQQLKPEIKVKLTELFRRARTIAISARECFTEAESEEDG